MTDILHNSKKKKYRACIEKFEFKSFYCFLTPDPAVAVALFGAAVGAFTIPRSNPAPAVPSPKTPVLALRCGVPLEVEAMPTTPLPLAAAPPVDVEELNAEKEEEEELPLGVCAVGALR